MIKKRPEIVIPIIRVRINTRCILSISLLPQYCAMKIPSPDKNPNITMIKKNPKLLPIATAANGLSPKPDTINVSITPRSEFIS